MIKRLAQLASLLAIVALIGCGGGKKEEDEEAGEEGGGAAPAAAMATVDMANGATITGMITIDGSAPAAKAIKMDADPVCKSAHSTPQMDDFWIVDGNGGVANALVYLKGNLGTYAPTVNEIELDQKGCIYHPRVSAIVAGASVKIHNSDQTLHNIHSFAEKNAQFNEGQPAGAPANVKKDEFSKPEIMIPIKCDVHGWMKSYIGVLSHPFFAVTGPDGKFEIKGVPAGEYTLAVWHESSKGTGAGVQTEQKITIAAKESKAADMKIKPE